MRRWNGWGDETIDYPLPDSARSYLSEILGSGDQRPDAALEELAAALPKSPLPDHNLLSKDPVLRLRHARGQSLPDWIALRSGRISPAPDAVAFPETSEHVRMLLDYAHHNHVQLIPYGGGTSVVGHINPLSGFGPALTVSMRSMNRLLELDAESRLATFGAGANGPEIEMKLGQHDFTLGHFPQSWELSTLGGWVATRSSGQQSYFYGRIEDLLRGATLITPAGSLTLPSLPASAAGLDLKQVLLGSEGRMGFITQATVRVRPLPMVEDFYAAFFPEWEAGVAAAREIGQRRVGLSMLRLSDVRETETTLALSGHERLMILADRGLRMLGQGSERCLMIYGVTGEPLEARQARVRAEDIFRAHGGLPTGNYIGRIWERSRFRAPYLRNTLWEAGYALDTLESAAPWSSFAGLRLAVLRVIRRAFESQNAPALVFSHLSHLYEDGVSFYVTYLFPRQPDPDATLEMWHKVKDAASEAIVAQGGTISHQHGVGSDHLNYLENEKSGGGIEMLRNLVAALDPEQIFNPGKLIENG